MGKRKRIGLIYNYYENWIAGTYYIENIIFALNSLSNDQKPLLLIYAQSEELFSQLKSKTNYPYLKYKLTSLKYDITEDGTNKTGRILLKKRFISKIPPNSFFKIDFIYPNPDEDFFSKVDQAKKIYWIPDFQEDHIPDFFSKDEIIYRKNRQIQLAQYAKRIVLSSNDAYKDFVRLYPLSKAKTYILPFVVHKYFVKTDIELIKELLKKYNINGDFILVPNQLWVHKNHKTVLYAVKKLVKEGSTIQLVFTGKENDYRFPNYPLEIKQIAEELGIQKQAKFIGFIPKVDLENLMIAAKAIIQPSLFEGWSTIIEEAKQYNKFVIASDIPIHLEQLENYPNKVYFSKEDPLNLAEKLKVIINSELNIQEYNYQTDIEQFSQKFLNIFNS